VKTTTWWSRILLLLYCLTGTAMAVEQSSIQRARDWVATRDFHCTLTDGYQCIQVASAASAHPAAGMVIPAIYLPVWEICYRDFMAIKDLTPDRKELRHYRISFQETTDSYVLEFRGLLLPAIDADGQVNGVLPAVYGRSLRYVVNKNSRQITSRQYMK